MTLIEKLIKEDPKNKETIFKMRSSFNMTKQRCLNPKNPQHHLYGGRGIKIHTPWLEDFNNFVEDMGLRPEGKTLDRIDNNGPYYPENCRWASRSTQANNSRLVKSVTWEGKTQSIAEWEREKGFKEGTLKARLGALKYTVEEAFTKPVKYGVKIEGRVYKDRATIDKSKLKRGLEHPLTKFNLEEVMEIRRLYEEGGETFTSLSKKFGSSVETISSVIQKKRGYKNVN